MIKKNQNGKKSARASECHFSFIWFIFPSMNKSKTSSTLTHDKQTLAIDDQLSNRLAHDLFISAVKRAREERRQQAQIRSKKSSRQMICLPKKKKITIADIDRLFREKCFRPTSMRTDLFELYEKSHPRIRSLLDRHQIDQFIRTSESRWNTTDKQSFDVLLVLTSEIKNKNDDPGLLQSEQ